MHPYVNPSIYRCASADETQKVSYFRFAIAPAFRTWCVGHGYAGLSVDYALPKAATHAPSLEGCEPPTTRMR